MPGARRENFGDGIAQICRAIAILAARFPDHRFVYPVHLNPNVLTHVNRLLGGLSNVKLIAPQGYRNFVALMARSKLVPGSYTHLRAPETELDLVCRLLL